MLQYGFVTLFAVAFQLAPLIAYVSCIVEMYVDRKKMLRLSSRPVPASAQDIGAWFRVFEAFSYIAPGFNMAIVLFTYRGTFFGNDLDLFGRLLVFVIAERVLLFIKYAIATFIPDEPYRVQLQLKRKRT
ncbi:hypothetical protein EON62_00835 [archaeon]|nr:MAG: hypothetical protein EON62_00835 [archaeon]